MSADEIAMLMNEMHKIRGDISFVEMRQIVDLFQRAGFVKQKVVIANSATTTEKQIEQIEEMAKLLRPLTICICCPSSLNNENKRDGGCYLPEQDECPHGKFILKYCNALYNAGYRKQKEGEWIDRYKGKYANSLYVCSICDGKSLLANHLNELSTPTVKQILTPYCPHCGAKMKGGE